MTDTTDAMVELLRIYLDKTLAGKIRWEAESDLQALFHTVGDAQLRIYPRDRDGAWPFVLQALNSNGIVVGQIASEQRSEDGDLEDAPWGDDLTTLYRAARDSALRITETLDRLRESAEEEP
jgi:hypothetical protein